MSIITIATEEEKEFARYAWKTMQEASKRIDEIIKRDRDKFRSDWGKPYNVLSVHGPQRRTAYMNKVKATLNEESWQRFNKPAHVLLW